MIVAFTKSFVKDLKKYSRDEQFLKRIRDVILSVEDAASDKEISNLKKLKAEGS